VAILRPDLPEHVHFLRRESVCVREREKECVCEREMESVCVCVREIVCERDIECVPAFLRRFWSVTIRWSGQGLFVGHMQTDREMLRYKTHC